MKGATKKTPAVVVQGDDRGGEVILGLAVSKCESEGLGRSSKLNASIPSSASGAATCRDSAFTIIRGDEGADSPYLQRELADIGSRAASRTRTSAWKKVQKMLPKFLFGRRARRRASRRAIASMSSEVIDPDASMDLITVLNILSEHEHVEIQRVGAMTLHKIAVLNNNNKQMIACSYQAMECLFGLLSVSDPETQFYAALTLENVGYLEYNVGSFLLFHDAVPALLRLLSNSASPLGQKGAATALASLSFWRHGAKLILESPNSMEQLVALSLPTQSGAAGPDRGQDAAKRTFLNLSRWWEKESKRVLDVPNVLTVLAGLLDVTGTNGLTLSCLNMRVKACRALASLSSTKTNARRIARSPEFPLVLSALVRLLVYTTKRKAPNRTSWLSARKMAALAFANLCVTEKIQVAIVKHPEALDCLFKSFETEDRGRRIFGRADDLGSSTCSQVQERAAMALGNLSLARDNRRKIAAFGMLWYGFDNLGKILYQDTNPAAQEVAAWALANISMDAEVFHGGPVAQMTAYMNMMGGLVHLLELPKGSGDRLARTNQEPVERIQAREEAARAIANFSYATQYLVRIMSVPNMVKSLIGLITQRGHPGASALTEIYASRAIGHLSATQAFWSSTEIFAQALPGLSLLLSSDAAEMCWETKLHAAVVIGNFAQWHPHQWKIISSKLAMQGLVKLLHGVHEDPWASEEAARVIFFLATGPTCLTKVLLQIDLAFYPGLVSGLKKLLGYDGPVNLIARDHVELALESLGGLIYPGLRNY